ncbi:hypothetical protein LCGC14_1662310 [marine sediment metagenome]|uniref:Bacteriophage lambda Replication protein O N-terminal domain-containing protein n=1 Tax=marine sediment metagenome TaxID=412755 RepID=A0A0F9HTQ7_9ZZZZ
MVFERKPSDYRLREYFYNSVWNNTEYEIVVRNILNVLFRDGNEFKPFSLDYYAKHCVHNVSRVEKGYIENLHDTGYLDFKNSEYSVNLKFISAIEAYRKKGTKKNGSKK